jgi:hypothetical protein
MPERFCKTCKGWHDLDQPWPLECSKEPEERSSLPFPMIIRDDMEPGVHPYDGREYASKSAWRAANRAGGYIEIGDDAQRFNVPSKPKPDRKGIRESLQKAKARVSA